MTRKEFWDECIALKVIVVPFMAYRGHTQDNQLNNDSTKVGIRFVCVEFDDIGILSPEDFRLDLELFSPNYKFVADTPELALELYKKYKEEVRKVK